MIEKRNEERRSVADRRTVSVDRRISDELGYQGRRGNPLDRRNNERRTFDRRA